MSSKSMVHKRYWIARSNVDKRDRIEISRADFEASRDAVKAVLYFSSIEAKYDVLLENFLDLRNETLRFGAERCLRAPSAGENRRRVRLLNRRLANFLGSARFYLDSVDHDLSCLFGRESKEREAYSTARSAAYDQVLAYRVMEGLRNETQHRDFVIRWVHYSKVTNPPGAPQWVAEAPLDTFALRGSALKASVLEELEQLQSSEDESLDLIQLAEEYLRELRRVHGVVRTVLASVAESYVENVENIITRAKSARFSHMSHIVLVSTPSDEYWEFKCGFSEMIGVDLEPSREFNRLMSKNLTGAP